jgi:methyl-accepting chemotaxis protein
LKSELGMNIADGTAKALDKIVVGIENAAEMMGKIYVSSNQQALGISQISSGLEQISKVVQINSATAEQSATSSEELSCQSDLLKTKVESFKLKASV